MSEQKPKVRKNAKPQVDDRTDAAGTVTVACGLPAGLSVDVRPFGIQHFKGMNDRTAFIVPEGRGFHGLTSGVPKEVWEALEIQYAGARWFTEGFLFAATKSKDAVTEAIEIGQRDGGFAQIDPEAIPGLEPSDAL